MLIGGLALLAVTLSSAQATGEIRGLVLDSSGGEPLAPVQVELVNTPHRTVTDSQGRFSIAGLPAGDYDLRVATVGHRLLKKSLSLAEGEFKELEIILTPDTLRHTDSRWRMPAETRCAWAGLSSSLSISLVGGCTPPGACDGTARMSTVYRPSPLTRRSPWLPVPPRSCGSDGANTCNI